MIGVKMYEIRLYQDDAYRVYKTVNNVQVNEGVCHTHLIITYDDFGVLAVPKDRMVEVIQVGE